MADRVLITGGEGFVGTHLREILGDQALDAAVDVLDGDAIRSVVRATEPRAVVHLAALSSVAASWNDVAAVWSVNVLGTVHVVEAVRREFPQARVLVASTGEVYGRAGRLPTPETEPVAPISPYAATKAAAELACVAAMGQGLDVLVTR